MKETTLAVARQGVAEQTGMTEEERKLHVGIRNSRWDL